jgi:hypothetical protein
MSSPFVFQTVSISLTAFGVMTSGTSRCAATDTFTIWMCRRLRNWSCGLQVDRNKRSNFYTSLREVLVQSDAPVLAFGSVPVFWKDFLMELRDKNILGAMRAFNFYESYGECDFNFKGLERRGRKFESVAQLRRSGLIRYSQQIPYNKVDGVLGFFPVATDDLLRWFIRKTDDLYKVATVSGPFLLGLTISTNSEVTGFYPDSAYPGATVFRGKIDPGRHEFPIMPTYDFRDVDSIMRPLCDQVHQGFGEEGSPRFGSDGNWRGKP